MPVWMMVSIAVIIIFYLLRGKSAMVPPEAVVSAEEAKKWIQSSKDLQILDVRTVPEYQQGHLSSSKLIPLHELEVRIKELNSSKPLFVYCAHGNRSAVALNLLRNNGFSSARHLQGGIASWQSAGHPVVR